MEFELHLFHLFLGRAAFTKQRDQGKVVGFPSPNLYQLKLIKIWGGEIRLLQIKLILRII